MQTFLVALSTTALAEIGDKTQFLVLMLAAKYRKPLPILFGILLATLASQTIAGELGNLIGSLLTPNLQRWLTGGALLVMAAWMLRPDSDNDDDKPTRHGRSVLLTTLVTFFVAEFGDKTQITTLVLAAHFQPLWQVILGSSAGLLAINVPVVWLGTRHAHRIPQDWTRRAAALLFMLLGLWTLLR